MKKSLLCGVLVCIVSFVHANEPMFHPDTEWNYRVTNVLNGTITKQTYGIRDSIVNGIKYQETHSILLRSTGAKVWCVVDSVGKPIERLLYDFDMQVGDSIGQIFFENEEDTPVAYYKVSNVKTIILPDGRLARQLSYENNNRPDDIEYIGNSQGLFRVISFPFPTDGTIIDFICCTLNGVVLYETAPNECDKLKNAELTEVKNTSTNVHCDKKILRNGQVEIQSSKKTYTLHGMEVK